MLFRCCVEENSEHLAVISPHPILKPTPMPGRPAVFPLQITAKTAAAGPEAPSLTLPASAGPVRGKLLYNRKSYLRPPTQFKTVMAGLDPAICGRQSAVGRRGWPCRARP